MPCCSARSTTTAPTPGQGGRVDGCRVAELQAEVEPGLHLGAQLAADVVEVDPTGCRAGHEGSVGQRESSGAVHERRHFTGAEQGGSSPTSARWTPAPGWEWRATWRRRPRHTGRR